MRLKTRDYILAALFAALISICSWLSVPAAVPFTMQTFGVFLSAALLGGKRGTLAIVVYIMLGAMGLPVFSGFRGGVGVLLNATGGYIIGFPMAALVMWGVNRRFGESRRALLVGMILGQLLCYVFGTAWFVLVYTQGGKAMSVLSALLCCVAPFLLPDGAKIALALLCCERLKKIRSVRELLD